MAGADIGETFAGLLDPIPGDEPTGPSLRYGPVHAAIEEARREEDAELPQGVWQRDVKRADDAETIELCRDALATKSKDLLIACWLVEAATRMEGLGAAAAGMEFLARLCGSFWDGLHPLHDGDADSPRYAPIVWLDGTLARFVRLTPVVRGEREGKPLALSWSDYEQARHSEAAQRRAKPSKKTNIEPAMAIAEFDAIADSAPREGLWALEKALNAADRAAEALETTLTQSAGPTAPAMTALRRAIRDVAGLVGPVLARRPVAPAEARPKSTGLTVKGNASADVADAPPPPPPAGSAAPQRDAVGPDDRASAYRTLNEIAALLRRIEPHSPTPYLVERAVRWGGMNLSEVLQDLSNDGRDPEMLKWLMGMDAKK